nr:sulfur carrier protein ThiS [Brevibacterium zhoupengii]
MCGVHRVLPARHPPRPAGCEPHRRPCVRERNLGGAAGDTRRGGTCPVHRSRSGSAPHSCSRPHPCAAPPDHTDRKVSATDREPTVTDTISITLNGERHELARPTTARDLVSGLVDKDITVDGTPVDGSRLGIALAVDGEVIRRGKWSEFTLAEGHNVDIVTAVQGG